MAKSKKELLAIRDESYRVVYAELCRTCRHWHRPGSGQYGLCRVVAERSGLPVRVTVPDGTCDLWEGKPSDQ